MQSFDLFVQFLNILFQLNLLYFDDFFLLFHTLELFAHDKYLNLVLLLNLSLNGLSNFVFKVIHTTELLSLLFPFFDILCHSRQH